MIQTTCIQESIQSPFLSLCRFNSLSGSATHSHSLSRIHSTMSTTSTPCRILDFWGVRSETKRIMEANSRIFTYLTSLFLSPIVFPLSIYPFFPSIFSQSNAVATIFPLFVFLLSLCAVATVTYSTHHGFYGRPVKFISAIKSLRYSFLPLLATTFIFVLIVALLLIAFALFMVLVICAVEKFLVSDIDYNSDWFHICFAIVFVLVLVWLQVNWALACVVVVVESKWGFEPLRRSAYLIRGMRLVSPILLYVYLSSIGGISFGCWNLLANYCGWKSWGFRLDTAAVMGGWFFAPLSVVYYLATITVLYLYYKALHGELAFEIEEDELGHECVSLSIDDGKVTDSIVQASGG